MNLSFIKFQVPKELAEKVYDLVEISKNSGKVRKGSNEVTKAIERSNAQLVIMAEDVSPPEILMHIPSLCDERGIHYCYVPSKKELGSAAGLEVPTAAIAISDAGEGKELLMKINKELDDLKKG
jgi:large subunit ribosomal protein L7Ae